MMTSSKHINKSRRLNGVVCVFIFRPGMTTREEKLAAARKKLRAYMGQTRDSDNSRITGSSNTSSPSPSLTLEVHRSESPVDPAQIAWERRQTLDMGNSPIPDYVQMSSSQHLQNLPEASQRPASGNSILESESQNSALHNSTNVVYSDSPEHQLGINPFSAPDSQIFMQREAQFQEQLRRHGQAINVLISERNDSQAALSRVQAQLHEKSDALEDLKHKYLGAIQRIRDFEENPPQVGPIVSHISAAEEEKRNKELQLAQQRIITLEEQLREIRQKFEGKKAECESLAQDVRQLRNDLSVSDVRIQQLSVSETSVSNIRIEELETQRNELERKVSLLERRLQAAAVEGEQAGHRFQMYADQCSSQIAALRSQVMDLSDGSAVLKSENEALKRQIADLEAALVEARHAGNPLEDKVKALIEENGELAKNLTEKEGELVVLRGVCDETEEKLSILQTELERLNENKRQLQAQAVTGHADPALLAAMESDKVAASRAVSQNKFLKEQLAELEAAFVRMSNEKSEIMEKLSQQEHENKELRKVQSTDRHDHNHNHGHHKHDHNHDHVHDDVEHDSDDEKDIDSLRLQVTQLRRDKTELMTRLQYLTADGKSHQPHQNQSHKHSHGHHHHEHKTNEHDDTNHEHVHDNSNECDHDHDHDHEHEQHAEVSPEVEELKRMVEQLQEDKAELLRRLGAPSEDPEVHGLLEEKLRRTMDEIAALDEEKQRLEHLVLQLQGETETIGEYISLYHKQRMLLRKRSLEKDQQLQQLTKDREELKEKLASLNELVDKLVVKGDATNSTEFQANGPEEVTASRIRALITEIGQNNVVNAQDHGVEHCFCCSGRLQTV